MKEGSKNIRRALVIAIVLISGFGYYFYRLDNRTEDKRGDGQLVSRSIGDPVSAVTELMGENVGEKKEGWTMVGPRYCTAPYNENDLLVVEIFDMGQDNKMIIVKNMLHGRLFYEFDKAFHEIEWRRTPYGSKEKGAELWADMFKVVSDSATLRILNSDSEIIYGEFSGTKGEDAMAIVFRPVEDMLKTLPDGFLEYVSPYFK